MDYGNGILYEGRMISFDKHTGPGEVGTVTFPGGDRFIGSFYLNEPMKDSNNLRFIEATSNEFIGDGAYCRYRTYYERYMGNRKLPIECHKEREAYRKIRMMRFRKEKLKNCFSTMLRTIGEWASGFLGRRKELIGMILE
jgi:hypothetical protein